MSGVEIKVSKANQTITVKSLYGTAVIHAEDIEVVESLSLEVVVLNGKVEVGRT